MISNPALSRKRFSLGRPERSLPAISPRAAKRAHELLTGRYDDLKPAAGWPTADDYRRDYLAALNAWRQNFDFDEMDSWRRGLDGVRLEVLLALVIGEHELPMDADGMRRARRVVGCTSRKLEELLRRLDNLGIVQFDTAGGTPTAFLFLGERCRQSRFSVPAV